MLYHIIDRKSIKAFIRAILSSAEYLKKNSHKMKVICWLSLILFINEYSCQTGFPKQFQATLNITGAPSWQSFYAQQLLYDYTNLRARIDVKGWRSKQNETYMFQYKPKGAESGSVGRH